MSPPGGGSGAANSLRPSAGGADEGTAPRARDVVPPWGSESLQARGLIGEPGSRSFAGGFSARNLSIPRAFHGFNDPRSIRRRFAAFPTKGRAGLSTSQPDSGDPSALSRAPSSGFDQRAPFRVEDGGRPRPGGQSPLSLDDAPRRPSGPLGRTVRVPEIRFYNRRSRHEHPQQNTLSGDCSPTAVGEPVSARPSDPLRDEASPPSFGRTLDHLAVIQLRRRRA
jgi:hypothetical protein